MGVGIVGEGYLWPNRTIPYEVDPSFRAPDRLAEAVAHWNSNSSIRFVPRQDEDDYVLVVREPGMALCDIGRQGREQMLRLGDGCTVGGIIHELGHAIGLCHEHCRPDRDDWVTIDEYAIEDGREDDFKIDFICGTATPTQKLGDYDFGSIMHYGAFGCAKDPDYPTIIPKQPIPDGVEMGQRVGLSAGDIAAVEELYASVPRRLVGPRP